MKTSPTNLDHLMASLVECITVDSARRFASLVPPKKMQARIERLSKKCNAGTLSDDERLEYQQLVTFGTFAAMLKSRARMLCAG